LGKSKKRGDWERLTESKQCRGKFFPEDKNHQSIYLMGDRKGYQGRKEGRERRR